MGEIKNERAVLLRPPRVPACQPFDRVSLGCQTDTVAMERGMRVRYVLPMIVAVAFATALPARADEVIRKAGEWQSTTTGVGPEPQTMTMCFAQMTLEQAMLPQGRTCTKRDIVRNGNRFTIDVECDGAVSQGTVTFSGDTAYTADLTTRVVHGQDVKVYHSITESKWIGACKPGQKVMGGG